MTLGDSVMPQLKVDPVGSVRVVVLAAVLERQAGGQEVFTFLKQLR